MALFTLTDIKFKKSESRPNTNPLLSRADFQNNIRRYPEDLGSLDKGHYMVFYINTSALTNEEIKCSVESPFQQNQTLAGNFSIDAIGQAAANFAKQNYSGLVNGVTNAITSVVNKTPQGLKTPVEYVGNFVGGTTEEIRKVNLAALEFQNFARKTRTIKDTIALYMPNTLAFNYNQTYDKNVSRNDIMTGMVAAGIAGKDLLGDPTKLGKNLSPFLFQAIRGKLGSLTKSSGTIQSIFASRYGAVNPRIEILYSRPEFRSFQFDFMFYPRSEKEAKEVQLIIQAFKFHQAPEIKKGTAGQFLVPPSDFNIEFYYNGKVNDNIPKIKGPCILDSINVDYAPDGFRAYESYTGNNTLSPELGRTGMPVGIRMTLAFTEMEFMTKDAYRNNDV